MGTERGSGKLCRASASSFAVISLPPITKDCSASSSAKYSSQTPEAMAIVVKHYESYIASLSMRKFRDERGNTYWGIDEDIRDRLRSRLMRAASKMGKRLMVKKGAVIGRLIA